MVAEATQPTQTEPEVTQGSESTEAPVSASSDESDLLALANGKATQADAATATEGIGTEGKESGEPDPVEVEIKAAKEAAAKSAAEEARATELKRLDEEKAREDHERYIEGVRQAYDRTAPALRDFLTDEGLSEEAVNKVLNTFTQWNGLISPATSKIHLDAFWNATAETLPEEERASFVALRRQPGVTYPMAVAEWKGRIEKEARKGYLSEAQVVEKETLAKLGVLRRIQTDAAYREAVLSKAKAPTDRQGAPSAGGVPTLAQWNAWTLEQREEMRRKDPEIETKIASRA